VYSIRSCPSSSYQKLKMLFIFSVRSSNIINCHPDHSIAQDIESGIENVKRRIVQPFGAPGVVSGRCCSPSRKYSGTTVSIDLSLGHLAATRAEIRSGRAHRGRIEGRKFQFALEKQLLLDGFRRGEKFFRISESNGGPLLRLLGKVVARPPFPA
jgi:hypothetical protein